MWWILGTMLVVLLATANAVGFHSQPWARWWVAGNVGAIQAGGSPPAVSGSSPAIHTGGVTDLERYMLAIGAGFNAQDAITITAISIAEDGSGDPAALSAPNRDGSRDLGLWQINSGWWPRFGGQAALTNPVVNALAAFYIYGRQGFCAWSVYEAKCGPGHTGAYAGNLGRAKVAANTYSQP
jgi:hypothetical protein